MQWSLQLHTWITFMTGVAGRVTVLTDDAELLFAVTVGEAGGITAALTLLLAPFAPLAAPAITQSVKSQSYWCKLMEMFYFTFNIDRDSYLFWLPCICHSCQKSRPQFGFSPQYPHHHHHHHHWTTTPHPHPMILHLCGICKRNHNHVTWCKSCED